MASKSSIKYSSEYEFLSLENQESIFKSKLYK